MNLSELTNISNIKRIAFRNDINGLRAVSVISVVLYHADIEIFKGGWLGVDLFFVISGYLISNIIISELNENNFSFKNFYLRRAKRILPALFSTLLFTIPFAYFLLTPKAMEEYIRSLIASIFFYANYHFQNLDYYTSESTQLMPLLHTWSLAIEEQYYLLFPLLAFLIYKYLKKYFTFFIILIIFSSLCLNILSSSELKFYQLQFRVWELFLGVLVMILSSNIQIRHLEKIGLPLMMAPIFYFDDTWIYDSEPKLMSLLGISLIIFSNTNSSTLSKILNTNILRFIGLSSYSIYLLHQPIFAFYRVLTRHLKFSLYDNSYSKDQAIDILNLETGKYINPNILILVIFSVVLIGYLSYKNIELKLNNNGYILTSFLILIFFSTSQTVNPNTFLFNDAEELNISTEEVYSDYPCWNINANLGDSIETYFKDCYIDNDSENYMVLLGDSSSASIAKNIQNLNPELDYNFLFLTIGYEKFFNDFKTYDNCGDCVLSWIKNNSKKISVTISVELHRFIENNQSVYYTEKFSSKDLSIFRENINILSTYSKNLIFIEPFPTMDVYKIGPRDLLTSVYGSKVKQLYIPLSDWNENTLKTSSFLSELSKDSKIEVLEINDLFCSQKENKCYVYDSPNLFYLDATHLTIEGSFPIVNRLISILRILN